MRKYEIYPSLLDAFNLYRGYDGEGAPLVTEEELIARINRVKRPTTEDQYRGIVLEAILSIWPSLKKMQGRPTIIKTTKGEEISLEVFGGMVEVFSPSRISIPLRVLNQLSEFTDGGTWGELVESILPVSGALVRVYGYIDVVKRDRIIDVKVPRSYSYLKYESGIQRHAYPIGLKQLGVTSNYFDYLVTDLDEVYRETYKIDLQESQGILVSTLSDFIDFIEAKRLSITDKKIYGSEFRV